MNDDGIIKKVFLGKPDERRKAGRPKLKWLDGTENDLNTMGVKRWRKKAEDRSVWAIILKEVLVKLLGPYANKEDVLVLHLLTYNILIIDCETVSKIQRNRILCFKIFGISAPPATVRCEIGWPQNS